MHTIGAALVHALTPAIGSRVCFPDWKHLLDYLRVAQAYQSREQVRILFLTVRNALIADEVISEGTIDQAPVFVREVIHRALDVGAAAIIMVHNHPSGDPTPSRADIDITRVVITAARSVGVAVHDHLIIAPDGHASFKALGLI